jgi:hypothetical protein
MPSGQKQWPKDGKASNLYSVSSLVGSLHFPLILHPWQLRRLSISALLTGLHGKATKIELFLTGLSWQGRTKFCEKTFTLNVSKSPFLVNFLWYMCFPGLL